jgi:oligopeptide transport system substrate-binding protein
MMCSCIAVLSSCKRYDVETFEGNYTYNDSVSVLSTNWNPHTYQTSDESYPIDFITAGLYSFIFNDEVNPVEGKENYSGYKIVPEMASELPIDVTEKVKKNDTDNKYGIPESATSGYAYRIKLNKNATWQNGVAINADTYIYSMEQLLNPQLLNYRASDYFSGSLCIANAENFYYQGQTIVKDGTNYAKEDYTKNADGQWLSPDGFPMFVAVSANIAYFDGENSLADYVNAYGDAYFSTTHWDKLVAAANEEGLAPLTDESYEWIKDVITGNPNWNEDESYLYNYLAERKAYASDYSFENVGIYKSGEYEITIVLGKSLAGFNLLYNLSGNWIVYEELYEAGKTKVEGSDNLYVTNYQTSLETTMSYGPYKLTGLVEKSSMTFEKNENWYGHTDGEHIYMDPVDGKVYPMYQTTKIFTKVVSEAATRKLMFLKGELMGYGLQSEDFEAYRNSDYCYATPSETIFFFIFNGYTKAINEREKSLDTTKYDLQTMALKSFRQAVAVTYDKEALCTAVSPSRSGGYGLIGNS